MAVQLLKYGKIFVLQKFEKKHSCLQYQIVLTFVYTITCLETHYIEPSVSIMCLKHLCRFCLFPVNFNSQQFDVREKSESLKSVPGQFTS